jgi:hypothetical protein
MLTTLERPEAIRLRFGTVAIHEKRIPKAIAVTPTATPTNRPTQALPPLACRSRQELPQPRVVQSPPTFSISSLGVPLKGFHSFPIGRPGATSSRYRTAPIRREGGTARVVRPRHLRASR